METYNQIKNPETQKYIYMNGRTYTKLLKTYDEKFLSKQPFKMTHKPPRSRIPILPEIQQQIAHHSDIKTLLNLCNTNKNLREICKSKYFWDEQFKQYGLPLPSEDINNVKQGVKVFRHAYNSAILADYLMEKDFQFNLYYHYGGTDKIIKTLNDLSIKYAPLEYSIDNETLTINELGEWNPKVMVTQNNDYSLSLELPYVIENDDGSIEEINIEFNDFVELTKDEMFLFLYHFINEERFIYELRYPFHPGSYEEYSELLNIDFI